MEKMNDTNTMNNTSKNDKSMNNESMDKTTDDMAVRGELTYEDKVIQKNYRYCNRRS